MKRQFAFVLALLAALAVLGGCKAEKREETSDETPSTIGTAPPLLDIEVDKLITVEQVSEVLGLWSGRRIWRMKTPLPAIIPRIRFPTLKSACRKPPAECLTKS